MADENGEKTEEATDAKREEYRKKVTLHIQRN